MTTLVNAAVFIENKRRFKGVNVTRDGESLIVTNRANNAEVARYTIVATAKADMAWDVTIGDHSERLVAQLGCGCGGQKPYVPDAEYVAATR